MDTNTTDDGDPEGNSQFNIYYNYIYKYRIPVLIILYLVACTKPVQEGKMRLKQVPKNKPEKQENQLENTADSSDVQLVPCAKCGNWIPQNTAMKLSRNNYYCSSKCLEESFQVSR